MTAVPANQRIVLVHGPGDRDLNACLEGAGYRRAFMLGEATLWVPAELDDAPYVLESGRSDQETPLLLRIEEVTRLLGVGRSTVYELINTGDLEEVHLGRAARVPAASVEDLVLRLRSHTSPRPSHTTATLRALGSTDASQPDAANTA